MISAKNPLFSADSAKSELEHRLASALEPRSEVLEAYLFGSHATGRAQSHSDIDVAVYVDAPRIPSAAYGYAAELTAHLMAALRSNEIDVVVLNQAPPVLYHRVLRDGRRILARNLRATTTREGYALSRYCDYRPQLAKIEAARGGRPLPRAMTRGRPDPEVIRRHLAALREVLSNLRRHAGRSAKELRADADLRWIVERGLQLSAQNALDIATHLAAASGLDSPDYATAIDRLAEIGVLTPEFASRLRPMAGFRNILVHGYLQVDLELLERVLRDRLQDLDEFALQVETYLARDQSGG